MASRSPGRSKANQVANPRSSRFGELEGAVMRVVWEQEGWLTPAEVRQELPQGARLAYTTVMTVLVRLWKKGLLERQRDGKAFAYHALESREQWTARRMEELLSAVANPSEALTHFVRVLDRVDRDQLRRILRAGRPE